MRYTFLPVYLFILFSCDSSVKTSFGGKIAGMAASPVAAKPEIKSRNNSPVISYLISDNTHDDETATLFVVIADTGNNYFRLREKMFGLSNKLELSIDTMGRYYDVNKPGIVLPLDSEDEIYAGEYYPRRYPSHYLSIEYLGFYFNKSKENTMALVAAICEGERTADSLVSVIKPIEKNTFYIKADIYMGCMH